MTKEKIIDSIASNVKVEDVHIVRIYGVPMGVGYDMQVFLSDLSTGEVSSVKMHAGARAWSMPEHLRPEQTVYNVYKGRDPYPERYINPIKKYFIEENGFKNYLRRFKKDELIKMTEGGLYE